MMTTTMTDKTTNALKLAEEVLQRIKQNHYYCEDSWYSCPKAEDGCANDAEGDDCNCGADVLNAENDKALTAIREALAEQEKQEPVAWATITKDCIAVSDSPFENAKPLYAAPVDAKAIRSEALEEAAKVCEAKQSYNAMHANTDFAAAIRGLK